MLEVFTDLRYVGIFVGLVLTGMGLPIPEELLVIVAGVASYHGNMDWRIALPACLLGALLGDCAMYGIGYHFGHRLVRNHSWFSRLLHAEREEKVERMIRQHGLKVLMLARFLAGLRAPVYIAAGIMRVRMRTFVFIDALCALVVIPLFFGLGYLFGDRAPIWWQHIRHAEGLIAMGAIAAVAVGGGVWYYRRRKRARANPPAEAPPEHGSQAVAVESKESAP